MEARLAKLEAHMEHVLGALANLASLPERLARVETRLNDLPDKDWVSTKMRNWVGGTATLLGALLIVLKFVHIG